MKDVYIVTAIYCLLFVVLTTPTGYPAFGMSAEMFQKIHHFIADALFWAAALYICASGTYGAFARQDRFGLTQNHPMLNRILSVFLIISPFLAVLWNVRFVYVLLGLLLISHLRSRTADEKNVDFMHSRALSNLVLIPIFTLAFILMSGHDYRVTSIFKWGSTTVTDADYNGEKPDLMVERSENE